MEERTLACLSIQVKVGSFWS